MLMTELINEKKRGQELSKEQIDWWIQGYVSGAIPDYQVAALLMAIYFKGMSTTETIALTMAMAYSGDVADLSSIPGIKVDKHSTGGVADTTTLIVAPLAAACGIKVAKMSGRGLGHTGGTIDKLDSIPGLETALSPERFADVVNRIGLAVAGQSGNLVPADKKLYGLRDVIGAVDSLPLIASSVMSKKIAAGADAIVLDVKTGNGAFMSSEDDAFSLAQQMVAIGNGAGRRTVALITDMDQPLGSAVGNSLEVWEAIEVLKGNIKGPLRDLSLELTTEMLLLNGESDRGHALARAEEALTSGMALEYLGRMIEAQKGDRRVIEDYSLLPHSTDLRPVVSTQRGFITRIDTEAIGRAAMYLGAGRATAGDSIDLAVGLVMKKRLGDAIDLGEPLALLHVGQQRTVSTAERILLYAFEISAAPLALRPLVLGRVPKSDALVV
jgi:pyrimidine-nucleoside phosphorylase